MLLLTLGNGSELLFGWGDSIEFLKSEQEVRIDLCASPCDNSTNVLRYLNRSIFQLKKISDYDLSIRIVGKDLLKQKAVSSETASLFLKIVDCQISLNLSF